MNDYTVSHYGIMVTIHLLMTTRHSGSAKFLAQQRLHQRYLEGLV